MKKQLSTWIDFSPSLSPIPYFVQKSYDEKNNIELELWFYTGVMLHLQCTYAIGIALGRIWAAYEEDNFGNPKTITETKR